MNAISRFRSPPGLFQFALPALVWLAIAFASGAASAGTGSPPVNASPKTNGGGWECDRGFREARGTCVEVSVPENAVATQESYGRGWECRRGYREDTNACAAIPVPDNAYLDASGVRWACKRGFRELDEACLAIKVPHNAFLSDSAYGSGWTCERGYRPTETGCFQVTPPPNAHLDYSGNYWECDRSFERKQDRCVLP